MERLHRKFGTKAAPELTTDGSSTQEREAMEGKVAATILRAHQSGQTGKPSAEAVEAAGYFARAVMNGLIFGPK